MTNPYPQGGLRDIRVLPIIQPKGQWICDATKHIDHSETGAHLLMGHRAQRDVKQMSAYFYAQCTESEDRRNPMSFVLNIVLSIDVAACITALTAMILAIHSVNSK